MLQNCWCSIIYNVYPHDSWLMPPIVMSHPAPASQLVIQWCSCLIFISVIAADTPIVSHPALCWFHFWNSERLIDPGFGATTWPTNKPHLWARFLATRIAEVRTRVSSNLSPFRVAKAWATCGVDGSEERTCVSLRYFFLSLHFVKHIKANVSSYNYGKAGRIQTCQRIKTRANFDQNNHKQA